MDTINDTTSHTIDPADDTIDALRPASIRIITADVRRLVDFYQRLTGGTAVWANELFAEIHTGGCRLAIGSEQTVALFAAGSAEPAANRSMIIEFLVDDIDAEQARLRDLIGEPVAGPQDLPWGNRSLLFRDPDGNLINLFTPVGEQARSRFGR